MTYENKIIELTHMLESAERRLAQLQAEQREARRKYGKNSHGRGPAPWLFKARDRLKQELEAAQYEQDAKTGAAS